MPAMTDDATDRSRRAARGTATVFASILALLALIVAAACAWRVWQWNGTQRAQHAQVSALGARLAASERDAQNALDQRTRNLETAIGQISNQQFQGRDALLLDDAEFLLRAGQQRWMLFHDADAAARAYALADEALAQVSDQVYQPVRSAIANERAALAAAAAPSRMHA